MTLAQIMRLALRQLDEDPADISDFRDLFIEYLNEGYEKAVRDYLRPRNTFQFVTDDDGVIDITGIPIDSIVSVVADDFGMALHASMGPDGHSIKVYGGRNAANLAVTVIARIRFPRLEKDVEEPRLPVETHMALVDYICYRYKLTGNLAKQSQAQAFLARYQEALQRIRYVGQGSVVNHQNLYSATSRRSPW